MTKDEMVKRSQQALARLDELSPEEHFQQLVAWGIIDENGEPRFGQKQADNGHAPSEDSRHSDGWSPPVPPPTND